MCKAAANQPVAHCTGDAHSAIVGVRRRPSTIAAVLQHMITNELVRRLLLDEGAQCRMWACHAGFGGARDGANDEEAKDMAATTTPLARAISASQNSPAGRTVSSPSCRRLLPLAPRCCFQPKPASPPTAPASARPRKQLHRFLFLGALLIIDHRELSFKTYMMSPSFRSSVLVLCFVHRHPLGRWLAVGCCKIPLVELHRPHLCRRGQLPGGMH